MHWLNREYLLKGIYLGLLAFTALRVPDAATMGLVFACTAGGLVAALGLAAFGKLREGYRVQGRWLPFVLFLLLESPRLVYAGILLGTLVGAYLIVAMAAAPDGYRSELLMAIAGGAVLGVVFGLLRDVRNRRARLGLCLVLGAVLVLGALYNFGWFADSGYPPGQLLTPVQATLFNLQLLLGIPVFYLLTFAGEEEETEIEIGVMCAALGLGLGQLLGATPPFRTIGFLAPILIYFAYTVRVLPGLRVFKHAIRGYSYAKIGRFRQALQAFRRAVQLDPKNKLAREGLWGVHRALDLNQLLNDPETLAMIDLDLCLDRAGALLLEPSPSPQKLDEANRLLELVQHQQPALRPRVAYWRAVALTHARQVEQAAAELATVLDSSQADARSPQRWAVLLPAWQLALTLHEELRRRVGLPQLALPGRRMEAIAAVERQLAAHSDDPAALNLKRLLYQDLTEEEYDTVTAPGSAAPHFDHAYAQQLGLALVNDTARWQRGGEYLRIAARGMPAQGVGIFIQIAQAHERAGDAEAARHNYELAKRAGQSVGPANLSAEDRQAFFNTVKMLGEAAVTRGEVAAAIENYRLFMESERSGVETLRTLAGLYEQKGDALAALWFTEQGLVYNAKDEDFLARKDRYYYSVTPQELQDRLESVRTGFDQAYCLRKARGVLDTRNADLDLIDWAAHLIDLALVIQPDSMVAKHLRTRVLLRRGERDAAVAVLEEMYNNKPEKFGGAEEEEAWYAAARMLGQLYLDELGRPDLAVPCFNEFRKSAKSGADTLFKLGQAYEQLGDQARAVKCYENVAAYDGHPLVHEARAALYRLQAG